jgi:hypothetical protein
LDLRNSGDGIRTMPAREKSPRRGGMSDLMDGSSGTMMGLCVRMVPPVPDTRTGRAPEPPAASRASGTGRTILTTAQRR